MTRSPDQGVVLFNVLVIVAFMSLVVMAMVTMGDLAIARSQRFSEAGQATLFVTAGEQTALSALLTDLADKNDTDNRSEAWARIAQDRVEIAGGFFALEISDAQALYNLTNLRPLSVAGAVPPDERLLAALVAGLDLDPDLTNRITRRMADDPPVTALTDLTAGQVVSLTEAAALAAVVTVLPLPTEINLNTAPLPVLSALLGNPPQARQLDSIRSRAGFLTPADLSAAQVLPDARAGFTSSFFRVGVTVTVGQTEQAFTSLMFRDADADSGPLVRIVSRTRALAILPVVAPADETLAQAQPVSAKPTATAAP